MTITLPTAEQAIGKLRERERSARRWNQSYYADELAEYAALITAQAADIERLKRESTQSTRGWLFENPDTGTEWAEQHPASSGECDDATNIRIGSAINLLSELTFAWEQTESDRRAHANVETLLRARAETAEASLAAVTAERDAIKKIIDFFYSPWGAWKTEAWEALSGDQPYSPDGALKLIRAALSLDAQGDKE